MKLTIKEIVFNTAWLVGLVSLLLFEGCGPSQNSPNPVNTPVAAYQIDYNVYTNRINIQSIDVTPSRAGQNQPGKAGIFQVGNAVVNGNLITVTAYITNNNTKPWTGVEIQAYKLLSGNSVTVYNPDFGTGWYVNNPGDGAWGWLFTSGTAGSAFTIPSGGRSANKINGFYTTSNFRAIVYIYANVPVISSINPSSALTGSTVTISGYNFSTTQGSVTFNGITATVQSWTNNSVTATVPTNTTLGNVIVDTVYANTPYSNPVLFTPYSIFSNSGKIKTPAGITVDTTGNLYVAVYRTKNYIAEITPSGVVSVYSRSFLFSYPLDVALVNPTGDLYVANCGRNNVLRVNTAGKASTFAAVGSCPNALGFSNEDQSWPLYVSDENGGTIYSIASNGTAQQFASGFTTLTAIAVDHSGNVYTGDCSSGNVYMINAAGTVTTTVITGLSCPAGMKWDPNGNLYILDANTEIMYKYVPATKKVSVFGAGTGIKYANGGFVFNPAFSILYVSQDNPINDITAIPIK